MDSYFSIVISWAKKKNSMYVCVLALCTSSPDETSSYNVMFCMKIINMIALLKCLCYN